MIQKPFRGVQLNRTHPLAKGLVGCWLFNEATGETVFDLSGHGNNGTLENGVAWGSDGLDYDGVDDYVDCGNEGSLDITNAITLEAWVKTEQTTSEDAIVFKSYDDSYAPNYGNLYRILNANGKLNCLVFTTNGLYQKTGTIVIADNSWHHVVGVFDSSINKLRMYVDGIQDGSDLTTVGILHTSIQSVAIGSAKDCLDTVKNEFNGSIDSVRIYNRALSAEEVMWNYREPYAMFEPAFNPAIYGAVFTKREILNLTSRIDQTLATTSIIDQTLATTSIIDQTLALSSKMDIEAAA